MKSWTVLFLAAFYVLVTLQDLKSEEILTNKTSPVATESPDIHKANEELKAVQKSVVEESVPADKKVMKEGKKAVLDSKQERKSKQETENKKVLMANEIAPLKGISEFHAKEIQTVDHMMERWSKKFMAASEGHADLKLKIKETEKELDQIINEGNRKNRRKISGLKKYLKGLVRDETRQARNSLSMKKELSKELKEYGRSSQSMSREVLERVILEIQSK